MRSHLQRPKTVWIGSLAVVLAFAYSSAESQEISVTQAFLGTSTEIRIISTDQPTEVLIKRTGGWRDRKLEIELTELWTQETLREVIPVYGTVKLNIKLSPYDDFVENDSEYAATITAREGNDSIYCGWGNDIVYLGNGNDVADLGSGDDRAFGGPGIDAIRGSYGDDYIRGGSGNDWLWGDSGDDEMHGGGGSDRVYGGDGNDYLAGGAGADAILGAQGFNTLIVDASDLLGDWPVGINLFVFMTGSIVYSGEYAFDYVAVYANNP